MIPQPSDLHRVGLSGEQLGRVQEHRAGEVFEQAARPSVLGVAQLGGLERGQDVALYRPT